MNNRKLNIISYGLFFIFIIIGARCKANNQESKKPNILLLIAEDMSLDLGCYGNNVIHSPNLDQMAEEGMRYTNVYTTSAVCSPSRTALATGMYQTSIGAYHMRYPDSLKPELPPNITPHYTIMQDYGYYTANLKESGGSGKSDWLFDYSWDKAFQGSSWKEIVNNQPFYAQINFSMTHRPYRNDTINPINPSEVNIPPYYPDNEIVQKDWASYLEDVQILDKQIGKVFTRLKEENLAKNTVVIFMSDHGRAMIRGKYWNYDSGLNVPFIIRWPENIDSPPQYKQGKVNNRLISSIDITATILSIADIRKPKWMQGKVFLGNNAAPPRDYVFSASDRISELHFQSRSVRSKQYRYTINYNHDFSINKATTAYRRAHHPIFHVIRLLHNQNKLDSIEKTLVNDIPHEEFYNLKRDSFEVDNLAKKNTKYVALYPQYQSKIQNHRSILIRWINRINDKAFKPDSPGIMQHFQKYGKNSYEQYEVEIQELRSQIEQKIESK